MTLFFSLILSFSMASLSFAFQQPTVEDKLNVHVAVNEVGEISRTTDKLDDLGRNSFKQSRVILDIGPRAVYILPRYLSNRDWKVRFWIVDILGYLDNKDAQRPLLRVIQKESERKEVKRRAIKSLEMLKISYDLSNYNDLR